MKKNSKNTSEDSYEYMFASPLKLFKPNVKKKRCGLCIHSYKLHNLVSLGNSKTSYIGNFKTSYTSCNVSNLTMSANYMADATSCHHFERDLKKILKYAKDWYKKHEKISANS